MTLPDTLGNMDIWSHVLQHFKISLDNEVEISEAKEKRKTLLHIALLSPALTGPALDMLWRTMSSLEPVSQVINSKASSVDDRLLAFQQINSGGYWVLKKPFIQEEVCDRALGYLSRIRHLYIQTMRTREMALWPVLSGSMGLGSTTTLLPRLKSLSLNLTQTGGTQGSWINFVLPLISPTLTTVSYTAPSTGVCAIECLQNMLSSQSLGLVKIAYHGFPFQNILQTCVAFEGLESLKLAFDPGQSPIQRYSSGPTVTDVFGRLRRLKELEVDLRFLPLHDTNVPGLTHLVNSPPPTLRKLHIMGDSPDFDSVFQGGFGSSSTLTLCVSIFQTNGLVWKTLSDRINTSFPGVRSLTFRGKGPRATPLAIQDLSALTSRPNMESLRLDGISHCFTDTDITVFLKSWPKLDTLAITNEYNTHFDASLLCQFSRMEYLCCLELPLLLDSLMVPLSEGSFASLSPLRQLTITSLRKYVYTFEDKIRLARNIAMLFFKTQPNPHLPI